jgi:DNA-binding beta-propeller fold protein YncE
MRLSSDGTRLFAVNTANNSLSVFNVSTAASPTLLVEIPVGLGPVSVNPLSNDVAWVVNQVSNSISVISVSKGIVTSTINVKVPIVPLSVGASGGEPMDVVFAGAQAYVSVSRAHQIAVFNTTTLAQVTSVNLFGDSPRAMAISPDGKTVYAALALAGNGTTLIPNTKAPPQCGTAGQPQCVPPMNPSLPPPPKAGLIVAANDPTWYPSFIKYTMPANGVAVIKTGATPTISYYPYVGTVNLGLGVSPVTGDLYVANTDALNTTNFEDNLCGHFVNNRITHITVATGTVNLPWDLNPTVTYGCAVNTNDLSIALAQPAGVLVDPSGTFMYVAAFGTDRVAKVDTNGNVMGFVDVSLHPTNPAQIDPANKRGPRGLALNPNAHILYSLNRIANTISVISTSTFNSVSSEVAVGTDLTPAAVKAGRGFLYDAKLSGTGTASCAGCHIDSEMDHLSWNLGSPTGDITSFAQDGQTFLYHPMKGPMFTQPLRGLNAVAPYHWRGDKPDFAAFNAAFPGLMGGNLLADSDMANFTTFINTVLYLPNPNRNLDNSLPTSLNGGNPVTGETDFQTLVLTTPGPVTCNSCHSDPGPGTNLLIRPADDTGAAQPIKVPHLRAIYQKQLFTRTAGAQTIDGFGMVHDGTANSLAAFFTAPSFSGYSATQKTDISAYCLTFDTGTAPAVGYTRTLTFVTLASAQNDWNTLQLQAATNPANIDLIARGTLNLVVHGLLYQPGSNNYISDTGALYTQSALQTLITNGDTLSVMGVYPGTGSAATH